MKERLLQGWVRRFWIFLIMTSIVAFLANIGTQFLMTGEADFSAAVTVSVTTGFVIAVILVFQLRPVKVS